MPSSTLDTIEELLRSIQKDVTDSETLYKIRNARQLVQVLEQKHDNLDEAIDETITDEEILENLRELGYFE
jgi:transcription termination factor NusB